MKHVTKKLNIIPPNVSMQFPGLCQQNSYLCLFRDATLSVAVSRCWIIWSWYFRSNWDMALRNWWCVQSRNHPTQVQAVWSRTIWPIWWWNCSIDKRKSTCKSCRCWWAYFFWVFSLDGRVSVAKTTDYYYSPSTLFYSNHPVTTSVFFADFSSFLESVIMSSVTLLIAGDFNILVDVPGNADGVCLKELLESMGLPQHVNEPEAFGTLV